MFSILALVIIIGVLVSMRQSFWRGVSDIPVVGSPPDSEKLAVIQSIAAQMQRHGITIADLAAVTDSASVAPVRRKGDIAGRLFSTLGGIFIFAGVGVYISMFWSDMNSAMRIIITLGFGLVLQALALVALGRERWRRAAMPLLLIAVVMQTGGWFVVIDELFNSGSDPRYAVLFVMGVMFLQQLATFMKYPLTLVLFNMLVFGYALVITMLDLLDANSKWVMLVLGVSMMSLSHSLHRTPHASLSSLGYFLGGCAFYVSLFDIVRGTPVELLYLGSIAGLIYLSTIVNSASLLSVSTFAMLGYIGYYTQKYFVDSVGWPISLVMLGVAFFVISGFAMRVKKRYIH